MEARIFRAGKCVERPDENMIRPAAFYYIVGKDFMLFFEQFSFVCNKKSTPCSEAHRCEMNFTASQAGQKIDTSLKFGHCDSSHGFNIMGEKG